MCHLNFLIVTQFSSIRRFFFLIIIVLVRQISFSQIDTIKATSRTTYISYAVSGLGSNMGSFEPTVRVVNGKFTYTYEQNSYRFERDKSIRQISKGIFRQSSIDSIFDLMGKLKDTLIFRVNPCIMSGAIYFLTIAEGQDTTKFEMGNTFDSTAIKIIQIINQYLPNDKKIFVDENFMKKRNDCINYMKELDKKKQDTSKKNGT